MLYAKALNGIYGIMKAGILFYKRFVGDITNIGFKINSYYPFVANNIININQMTVAWYVDYIKSSHEIKKIVTRMEKLPKNN